MICWGRGKYLLMTIVSVLERLMVLAHKNGSIFSKSRSCLRLLWSDTYNGC